MTAPAFSPGDQAPFCYGLTGAGVFWSFQAQAGRPVVLIVTAAPDAPGVPAIVDAFAARLGAFAANEADIVLMVNQQPLPVVQYAAANPSLILMVAGNAEFFAGLDWDGEALVLALDRSQRLVARFAGCGEGVVAAALAAVSSCPREASRDIVAPAPVLMIPHLIDADLCAALVARHADGGNFDSGFASADAHGAPIYKTDYAKKKRRDHLLADGDPLQARLRALLLRRAGPEIKKAFQVEIAHVDRLLIGRYDDDGGVFRRHRDNAHPSLGFRQFALSVGLNDGYGGGALVFPEYNAHRYRPGAGTGLVFSASLLHEVTPIEAGTRYVLLSFFHSAEAERSRLAQLAQRAQAAAAE